MKRIGPHRYRLESAQAGFCWSYDLTPEGWSLDLFDTSEFEPIRHFGFFPSLTMAEIESRSLDEKARAGQNLCELGEPWLKRKQL